MEPDLAMLAPARHGGSREFLRSLVSLAAVVALFFGPAAAAFATEVAHAKGRDAAIASRIPHQPVASRALASVGYSKRLRALEIAFKRGGTYRYLDVPPALFSELLAAESKARFYNQRVRGKFRSVRVRRHHR
jgi:hypothetical protein